MAAQLATQTPTAKLSSGYTIPLLGLGTSQLSGEKATEAVNNAIEMGYRHIDSAVMYGNEADCGKAIGEQLRSGKVKREELFIVTKLANEADQHKRENVVPILQQSCKNLQVDYVDLVLIHWPVVNKPTMDPAPQETWKGLEEAVDKGLVHSIGVSNHSPEKMQEWFMSSRIKPAVNQVEVHPYFRNDRVREWCQSNGVHVTAYAPLSSPASMQKQGNDVPNLITDEPTIQKIADKHGKSTSQVMLAWNIRRGVSVIPRAGNPDHIKENLEAIAWELPDEDFETVSKLGNQTRYFSGQGLGFGEDKPWKTYQELWNEEPISTTL